MAFEFMPGATVVGISYNNGVILAAEKRVSFGNFVVNKSIKKTFSVTDHVGAACAGDLGVGRVLQERAAVGRADITNELRRDDLDGRTDVAQVGADAGAGERLPAPAAKSLQM